MNVLEMIRLLESKGFTTEQAEIIVEQNMTMIQSYDLVTKDFLRAELVEIQLKMTQQETRIMASMAKMKWSLVTWMIGTQLTIAALILALICFLHK